MSELWFLKLPYRLLTGDFFVASCGHSWWCFCCQGVLLVLLSHCWSRWLLINKVCSPSVFFHSISSDLAQGSRLSSGENWIRIDWPVPSMRRPGQVTLTKPGENTSKVISLPTFCNYFFQEKKNISWASMSTLAYLTYACLMAMQLLDFRLLVWVSNRPEENIVIVKPTLHLCRGTSQLEKLISLIVKMMMTISEKETR